MPSMSLQPSFSQVARIQAMTPGAIDIYAFSGVHRNVRRVVWRQRSEERARAAAACVDGVLR